MSFNPSLKEIQAEAKSFIDQNIWDGDDRAGCLTDYATFNPDELQELVNDLLEHLSEKSLCITLMR